MGVGGWAVGGRERTGTARVDWSGALVPRWRRDERRPELGGGPPRFPRWGGDARRGEAPQGVERRAGGRRGRRRARRTKRSTMGRSGVDDARAEDEEGRGGRPSDGCRRPPRADDVRVERARSGSHLTKTLHLARSVYLRGVEGPRLVAAGVGRPRRPLERTRCLRLVKATPLPAGLSPHRRLTRVVAGAPRWASSAPVGRGGARRVRRRRPVCCQRSAWSSRGLLVEPEAHDAPCVSRIIGPDPSKWPESFVRAGLPLRAVHPVDDSVRRSGGAQSASHRRSVPALALPNREAVNALTASPPDRRRGLFCGSAV